MKIRETFQALRARGEAAFIPYITAGDPDLETTRKQVHALLEAGADLVELGVPFSDPMADGPVNQRSAERALRAGTTLESVLGLVARLRDEGVTAPLVLFTYFNPVHRMGLRTFTEKASRAGVSGALVLDLPPEEAQEEYLPLMKASGLETVFLASPTTPRERLRLIGECSTGFVYYVSRTGVTGAQATLSQSLAGELEIVKREIQAPVAVGFGISEPQQASDVARLSEGVVVGSALVKIGLEEPQAELALRKTEELARSLAKAVKAQKKETGKAENVPC